MKRLKWWFVGMGLVMGACASDGEDNEPTGTAGTAGASDGGSPEPGSGGGDGDEGGAPTTGGTAGSSGTAGSGGTAGNGIAGESGGPNEGGAGGESSLGVGGARDFPGDMLLDPACADFLEESDLNNDSELTAQLVGPMVGDSFTICGRVNARNSLASTGQIDTDVFVFDATAGDYLVTVELLADQPVAQAVQVYARAPNYQDGGLFWVHGGSGVTHLKSGAGEVLVEVTGFNPEPIERSIPYRLRVRKDDFQTRCAAVTAQGASQSFSEANDGASSNGNDVLRPAFGLDPTGLTPAADAPEASGIQLALGQRSLISGVSGNVNYGEDYFDGDTYAFRTGAVDQVSLRIDWTGTGVDFDAVLFKENELRRYALAGASSTAGSERATWLVEPNTNYWLWIGAADWQAQQSSLPKAYGVTLCAETYAF